MPVSSPVSSSLPLTSTQQWLLRIQSLPVIHSRLLRLMRRLSLMSRLSLSPLRQRWIKPPLKSPMRSPASQLPMLWTARIKGSDCR